MSLIKTVVHRDFQLSILGDRMDFSMANFRFRTTTKKNALPQEKFSVGNFDGQTVNITT